MKDAWEAEKSGSLETCQAIIRAIIGVNVDEEDRKNTWMDDAESCIAQVRKFHTALKLQKKKKFSL